MNLAKLDRFTDMHIKMVFIEGTGGPIVHGGALKGGLF